MAEIVTLEGNKKDREAEFVRLYVETGDCQKAALDAGFSHGTYGYELRDRLAHEIRQAVDKRITQVAPMALNTLSKLAESADSEAVRRQASKDIMSFAGFDIQRTEDVTNPLAHKTDEELNADIVNIVKGSPKLSGMMKEALW